MNSPLTLSLLGTPIVEFGNRPLTNIANAKEQALLFMLALRQGPVSRLVLASTLWPNMNEKRALHNLRTAIFNLRAVVRDYLIVTPRQVAFNRELPHCLDVAEIQKLLSTDFSRTNVQALQRATKLYRGEFLEGFHVRNSPDFEEWVTIQRAQVYSLITQLFTTLATLALHQNEFAVGLSATRRLLEIDPFHEQAHQLQMQLLLHSGQRIAAMKQYETCRKLLADEFDMEPMAETLALYQQIRRGDYAHLSQPETAHSRLPLIT